MPKKNILSKSKWRGIYSDIISYKNESKSKVIDWKEKIKENKQISYWSDPYYQISYWSDPKI